jgi:hypothetical protein
MIIKRTKEENKTERQERPKKTVFVTKEQVDYIQEELSKEAEGINVDENGGGKEYEIEELDSSRQTSYHEGQHLSNEEVMDLFDEIRGEAKKSNYRVGITCDPDRREKEHDTTFLAVVGCPSVDKANALEILAGEYGFDAGEHVGNASKGKKVYIFKK